MCAFERQTKFVKSWVFPFAFSVSPFFSSFFVCWPCGQKGLIYLTRMRRGSNNRETPKGVPSSKNNRQLVTCRPFRDSCMRTKPNSYRHGSYRLGRVYRQGSKTLFHAYGPRSTRRSTTWTTILTTWSSTRRSRALTTTLTTWPSSRRSRALTTLTTWPPSRRWWRNTRQSAVSALQEHGVDPFRLSRCSTATTNRSRPLQSSTTPPKRT